MWKERNSAWGTSPFHANFQTLTTTASHYPVQYYNDGTQATHQVWQTLTTSASHVGTISGYKYMTVNIVTLPRNFEEDVATTDSQTDLLYTYFEEDVQSVDTWFTGTSRQEEDVPITDSILVTILPAILEYISATDSIGRTLSQEEEVPILDQFQLNWTKYFEEDVATYDLPQAAYLAKSVYGLTVAIEQGTAVNHSFCVTTEVYTTQIDTLRVGIVPSNLSPVVSISALPSASTTTPVVAVSSWGVPTVVDPLTAVTQNPFTPTVILGGVTYATNSGTAPPSGYTVNSNTYFVQWLNATIGGENSCNLLNFDLSLDRQGGTFSITSRNNPGFALGDQINLFGLFGTVTEAGPIYTNSAVGTVTKGIFGSRDLNKQLNMLAAGNPTMLALLTNSLLATKQENLLGNYEGAAMAIAQLAGVGLSWVMPGGDIPLVDFTVSEGETALAALSGMASQFGGVLLWNGGNNYIIGPPTLTTGYWEVPSQALITPAGVQYLNKLDISTGAFGTGFYSIPIATYFDPFIYGLPNSVGSSTVTGGFGDTSTTAKVQKVSTLNKLLTAKDPLWIVDLPLDTEEVWLQLLVPQGQTSTGAQYVTDNPLQWTNIGAPSIAGPTAKLVLKGGALGALVPQAQIGSNIFTASASIDAVTQENFVFSVGVTRNTQSQLFEDAVKARDQQVRAMLAKLLGSFRYVQTFNGNINSFFFGSIPLPGMIGSATVCGNNVQGIIESVSLTYPGYLTVQVANYAEINFIKNFYKIDLRSNTGIT